MSLRPDPKPVSPIEAKVEKPEKAAAEAKPKPVVISFAMLKKDGKWHGLALKSQGRDVVEEKLLDSDEYRLIAQDAVDKASQAFWLHGLSPFDDKDN